MLPKNQYPLALFLLLHNHRGLFHIPSMDHSSFWFTPFAYSPIHDAMAISCKFAQKHSWKAAKGVHCWVAIFVSHLQWACYLARTSLQCISVMAGRIHLAIINVVWCVGKTCHRIDNAWRRRERMEKGIKGKGMVTMEYIDSWWCCSIKFYLQVCNYIRDMPYIHMYLRVCVCEFACGVMGWCLGVIGL